MIVRDNTIVAYWLGEFFENLSKKRPIASKTESKKSFTKCGKSNEIGASVGAAVASGSLEAVLSSLPELINFLSHRKKAMSGKNSLGLCFKKWLRLHWSYTHLRQSKAKMMI